MNSEAELKAEIEVLQSQLANADHQLNLNMTEALEDAARMEARERELTKEVGMWRNRYEIMRHQRDKFQEAILAAENAIAAAERVKK